MRQKSAPHAGHGGSKLIAGTFTELAESRGTDRVSCPSELQDLALMARTLVTVVVPAT